ncbi:B [Symbiodinium microadriaticum]|nr:B [Symbiodinium microadriaticum] [Symbiodinium microadriaticum]
MTLTTELAEIEAAISEALKAQKMKHGDDERELPDLEKLYSLKEKIQRKIARQSRGNANEHLRRSLEDLRNDSNDLQANNAIARGAIDTLRTNIVGPGLRHCPVLDHEILGISEDEAEKLEDVIEQEWDLYTRTCDQTRTRTFAELQALALVSSASDGDCFANLPMIERPGIVYETTVNLIAGHRICTKAGMAESDNLVMGVELDKNGCPSGYQYVISSDPRKPREWRRLRAFDDNGNPLVLHVFRKRRINQNRGEPILAPIIELVKKLDTYAQAEVDAAVINAFLTAFIMKRGGEEGDNPLNVVDNLGDETGAEVTDEDLKLGAGVVIELDKDDDDVKIVDPSRPNVNFDDFTKSVISQIAVGINMPFEVLMKQFQSSYSASKGAVIEADKVFNEWERFLIDSFCQPVYEAFMMEAVAKGRIKAPGFFDDPLKRMAYCSSFWIGPGQNELDPTKGAKAATARMSNGTSNLMIEAGRNRTMKTLNFRTARCVMNASDNVGTIDIYGTIGKDWLGNGIDPKEFKDELQALGDVDILEVRIHSYGGFVDEGQAICTALRKHSAEKHMFVDGIAASMASVILQEGDKRYCARNAAVFIHDPIGLCWGDVSMFERYTNELKQIKDQILDVYVERSTLSREEIDELMRKETRMTADQALEWGFIDEIGDEIKADPEDHSSNFDSMFKIAAHADFEKLAPHLALPSTSGSPESTQEEDTVAEEDGSQPKQAGAGAPENNPNAGQQSDGGQSPAASEGQQQSQSPDEIRAAERKRIADINAMRQPGVEDICDQAIEDNTSAGDAALAINKKLAKDKANGQEELDQRRQQGNQVVTDDGSQEPISDSDDWESYWDQNKNNVQDQYLSKEAFLSFKRAENKGLIKKEDMTTLAANAQRALGAGGHLNHLPMIAADIIYEGAAVGIVNGTGYARPLQGGDKFAGFADSKADNSSGAAGADTVQVYRRGVARLSVSGAVITDFNQPVYATDDDTFVFSPVGATFIGYVTRWVSSGVVDVEFDVNWEDPWGYGPVEAITGAKTLDNQDSGKIFFVTSTAVITLPATAIENEFTVVNGGPFGTVQPSIDPVAADGVLAPDSSGVDDKDWINTLATAQRGDYVRLHGGRVAGYFVTEQRGIWAAEA